MKTYIIKVVLKNEKPPVWVRIGVPHGITFAMLSLIFNGTYGLDKNNKYCFEFYQAKVRLQEEKNGRVFMPDFYYSMQEASNTYIDDYLDSEKWFSYLYSQGVALRCEIEAIQENALPEAFAVPKVIKLSKAAADRMDENEIAQFYGSFCRIRYGKEPDYSGQAELYCRTETPGYAGMNGMTGPQSKDGNIKVSANESLKAFSDLLRTMIFDKSGLENLMDKYREDEKIDDEDLYKIREQIESMLNDPAGSGFAEKLNELENDLHSNFNADGFFTEGGTSLREALISVYDRKDLIAIAGEYGIKGRSRLPEAKLADFLAERIADPKNIRTQLLAARDSEILLLEKLLAGEKFDPGNEQDLEAAGGLIDKEFIFEIETGDRFGCEYMVPDEIAEGYQAINTEEFRKEHKRLLWLRKCLFFASRLYCCVPVDVFMRLILKNKSAGIRKEKLPELIDTIPTRQKPCILKNGEIIAADAIKDDVYKKVKRGQGDKEFYIPDRQEIDELFVYGYPKSDPAVLQTVRAFCRCFDIDEAEAEDIIKEIWNNISFGADPQDLLQQILDEEELEFSDENGFMAYVDAMMKLNNETRMLWNRGYNPSELSRKNFRWMGRNGSFPTIVPGSSHAAEMLKQAQPEIEKMGFTLDFDSNAAEVKSTSLSADKKTMTRKSVKVYPNDPCPCGSGKKYKHCCGR